MNRAEKEAFVAELSARLDETPLVVLTDYRGTTVAETNALRRTLESHNLDMQVVKNTLAKKAISGTPLEPLGEHLVDMTAMIFSNEDPVASAKVIRQEIIKKKDSNVTIKAGYFDGTVHDVAGVDRIADMPSKEELLVMLLRTIQEPARRVMRVTQAPARDLLYLLKNYENKLDEGEGE